MKFQTSEHETFFNDIREEGFHIFSRQHAKKPGFYPNTIPSYPDVSISEIKDGDIITIRAFFPVSKAAMPQIDSGQIDLEVECVDHDAKTLFGNILTEFPEMFALAKGTSIELNLDEVLSVEGR